MNEPVSVIDFTLHYLAPAGAVMLLGLLGGKLARRLRMPKVTGYLVTGILIGPSLLGLLSNEIVDNLALISDIALGLIMFGIGGVFERHHIRDVGRKVLWLIAGQVVAVVVLTAVGLRLVGLDWLPALLLAAIAIETAPGATLLVIREFRAKGEFTDTLLTTVAVSNVVCILGFQLAFAFGELSPDHSFLYAFVTPLYEIGGSLVIGLCVGYVISRWEQHVEDQAELLMIIVAGVMLTTGLAVTLNLQPLFANLILGAVTTNLSLMHRLVYVELRQIEQPLYIAFFVIAGASLHIELLPALGLAGAVFLITRSIGKVAGAFLISKWRGFSDNLRQYLGLSTLVQAGVAIGLIDIVRRNDPDVGATIVPIVLATIIINETVGPLLIRYILFRVGDASRD